MQALATWRNQTTLTVKEYNAQRIDYDQYLNQDEKSEYLEAEREVRTVLAQPYPSQFALQQTAQNLSTLGRIIDGAKAAASVFESRSLITFDANYLQSLQSSIIPQKRHHSKVLSARIQTTPEPKQPVTKKKKITPPSGYTDNLLSLVLIISL